ncbi:MAG: glycosyltransferase family 39 protein [Planctomycetes bacterium]|nr:glycosyltransferase family 39 protein [Planctomycetota bacterium]
MPESNDPLLVSPLGGRKAAPPAAADAAVLLLCLALLVFDLGSFGLYEPHEGHFAGVGREMVLTGEWVVPNLNGSPYLNKPPLMYWSIALSCAVFGISEWSARLPSAVFSWLGVVVAWYFARRLWGAQAGRLAAGMLSVSAGWFLFSHQAMIDPLLSMLVLWSLYLLWKCVRDPGPRRNWLALYLVLALSQMAKGPVALLFVLLAFGGVVVLRKRPKLILQAGAWWGLPLLCLPIFVWMWYVEQRVPGFLDHFFNNEIINRIRGTRWPPDFTVSAVGPVGYLLVTAVWCAPWALFLPQTTLFAWRGAFGKDDGETPEAQARRDGVLILALGVLGPATAFLPMSSRLIYYSLPAVPAFAVLAAGWWLSGEDRKEGKAWHTPAALLLAVGATVFSAGFWLRPFVETLPEMRTAPGTLELMPATAWTLGAAMLAASGFLFARRPRAAAAWMILLLAWAWMDGGEGFMRFEDVRASRRMVAELNPQLGPDCLWVAEGSKELGASAGIAFYLGADTRGLPRTVRVMDDDPRRPQPSFGLAPRDWAMTHAQLESLWMSPRPAVFVTDLMRRDFEHPEEEPLYYAEPNGAALRLLPLLGDPLPQMYGFRKVYLNPAARKRLEGK